MKFDKVFATYWIIFLQIFSTCGRAVFKIPLDFRKIPVPSISINRSFCSIILDYCCERKRNAKILMGNSLKLSANQF